MGKGRTALEILLSLTMILALSSGVIFLARAGGLVDLNIRIDLLGIRFTRVVTALEAAVVGTITLIVGIAVAYVSLQILQASLMFFAAASLASIELSTSIVYFLRPSPNVSYWLVVMATSWWLYLYVLGPITEEQDFRRRK